MQQDSARVSHVDIRVAASRTLSQSSSLGAPLQSSPASLAAFWALPQSSSLGAPLQSSAASLAAFWALPQSSSLGAPLQSSPASHIRAACADFGIGHNMRQLLGTYNICCQAPWRTRYTLSSTVRRILRGMRWCRTMPSFMDLLLACSVASCNRCIHIHIWTRPCWRTIMER